LTKTLFITQKLIINCGVKIKKRFGTVFLVSMLMLSVASGTLFATTEFIDVAKGIHFFYVPTITINSDGTITPPEPCLLTIDGTVYMLTGDVEDYGFIINCDDIVFDGAGHLINHTNGDTPAIHLSAVNNVTIKNVETVGRYENIKLYSSVNCLLKNVTTNMRMYVDADSHNNTITENSINFLHIDGNNNTVTKNDILYELFVGGKKNTIYQNNIFAKQINLSFNSGNSLDNGLVGNYWSIYNSTDNDRDGIGDTPQVILKYYITGEAIGKDYYPLMEPVDIETIPEFPSWIILPLLFVVTLVGIILRNKIRKNGLE
jgi:hypothetical protein